MPVSFPTMDPDTGHLVDRDYYTVGEVAAMLHVSHSTVRRRILAGEWDHLTIAQGHYMDAAMVVAVVEKHIHRAGPCPELDTDTGRRPRLGTPLSDDDLEGMT